MKNARELSNALQFFYPLPHTLESPPLITPLTPPISSPKTQSSITERRKLEGKAGKEGGGITFFYIQPLLEA